MKILLANRKIKEDKEAKEKGRSLHKNLDL